MIGKLPMSTILPVLVGGEALFDFIATEFGHGLGGSRTFQKRVGGSPFNIAVGIRRLGVPASFVGKIGVDGFGDALVDFLIAESIDVTHVVREQGTKTILAFVAVDKQGKPEFNFYRDPCRRCGSKSQPARSGTVLSRQSSELTKAKF